jgi:hypothetical protein
LVPSVLLVRFDEAHLEVVEHVLLAGKVPPASTRIGLCRGLRTTTVPV